MAHSFKRNGDEERKPDGSDNADLSARLAALDARLGQADARRREAEEPRNQPEGNRGAIGQAFRLLAEFVSGVLAGGIVGWIVDRALGWSPWGLVVCLLLGFCAGMLNLLRAAGMVKTVRRDGK